MNNVALYVMAVLIWGTTWIAITFQLEIVPPEVSVVYRFALASLILFGYAVVRQLKLNFSLRDQKWMALQGLLVFSLTYVFAYSAIKYMTSGLVAIVFSFFVFLNMFGMRLFFKTPIRPTALLGAAFGVIGIMLIFAPSAGPISGQRNPFLGLAFAIAGTLSSSLGNMVTFRNYRNGIPVIQLNAFSMFYGALFVAIYALLLGRPFVFDWKAHYIISLLYLAIVGSVVAFVAYVTLIGRIGADRAGYIAVAVPVMAFIVSTLFEGLQWQLMMFSGLACCVVGNVLVLRTTDRR